MHPESARLSRWIRGLRGTLRIARVLLLSVMMAVAASVLFLGAVAHSDALRVRDEVTGSMAPTLQVDDLVVYRPTTGAALRPGDVIGFRRPGGSIELTHRVVAVHLTGDAVTVVTKGDANMSADQGPTVLAADAAVWRVWFALPAVGRLATQLGGGNGLPFVLGLIPLLYALARIQRELPADRAGRTVAGPS
jgi:signal peptidase